MKKTIDIYHKCKSCDGTGLYVGMAERDGYAVVCYKCEGTGKQHFVYDYEEFDGICELKNIHTVIQCNPGICVGGADNRFGGMTYTDWKNGNEFKIGDEMREYTCPTWYYQTANYKLKPEWKECYSSLGCTFSKCPHFVNKQKCWDRFDKEHK